MSVDPLADKVRNCNEWAKAQALVEEAKAAMSQKQSVTRLPAVIEKPKRKVFIVPGAFSGAVCTMFKDHGWEIAKSMKEADLLQFTGGEDIDPALYNKPCHPKTYPNPIRDRKEVMLYQMARAANMPMAGICRGAQLLNVLAGGSMWQHVDMHNHGYHPVVDVETGEVWDTTSVHHQMMVPTKDVTWIGKSRDVSTFREKCDKPNAIISIMNNFDEPEVLYYQEMNALLFQGHPEIGDKALQDRYFDYLERYCVV